MKAIMHDRYGGVEVLSLREIPEPAPVEGEVLVRVHAAGVDPGVWHLMTGTPYLVRLFTGVRAPRNGVRGRDVAGRVEAVGAGVTEFRVGDAVFGVSDGSFAELARVSVGKCVRKPGNLSFEQAAALPVSGLTALHAVRDVVQAGQKVLVVGAGGGVGTFAVQLAGRLGAKVTGVCSTEKAGLVRSLGAEVIDYTTTDFADGTRYDVILDIAGLRRLSHLRRALTRKGTLVLIGGEGGGKLLGGLGRGIGAMVLSPFVGRRVVWLLSREHKDGIEELARLAEAGELTPVVDRSFSLADAAEAIRYLEHGRARGKVVVRVLDAG